MKRSNMFLKSAAALIAITTTLSSHQAFSTQINFTGGQATLTNGNVEVPNNNDVLQNVTTYVKSGFQFEFFFAGIPQSFSSIVGDFYSVANDVTHVHWSGGGFGDVSELKVSKVDGTTFDLGGFKISSNTATGGGAADGNELVSINTDKANSIFNLPSDDWGLNSGSDPLITIDPTNLFFDDISWFSFTNDIGSSAVSLGLDDFFLDEAGDPNGFDPTGNIDVPIPATAALLVWGLVGVMRRKK